MKYEFSVLEARIIGCLLEKQVTTPEQYPMSLNGLTLACNQKTNRDPVMEMSESAVQNALDLLVKKHLIRSISGFGNRVMKYEHRFCNSEFGELKLSPPKLAILCLLLLRGAQTAGELRSRAGRLYEFRDVGQVEQALTELSERPEGALVVRLAREPGKRENRYMHLLGQEQVENQDPHRQLTDRIFGREGEVELVERVSLLEEQVKMLQQQLTELRNAAQSQ